ncbi:MAG: TonB-dependent receptor [Pedobacter sp.]|uniref:SusC/RagA family TonB-linked outer membrane protein n=1 Tax=Pedobacter sp. TaxID=1411316 RepID=UPI00280686AE|nr:TonB-dependent receptor [Pedobacter sp.]MDQ8005005.1 TonB-dependent receptor [Pedobacter sp.]
MKKRFQKKRSWFFPLLVFLLSLSVSAMAQTRVVGITTDEQGEILTGVSVTVKGTKQVSISDKDGKYQIVLPSASSTLVFTYVGYETREVQTSAGTLNISLKANVSTLNSVVVVGYGTVARKDLTGSVGSVSVTDMQKAPVRSLEEALAGRVAGVQVSSSEGGPGASVDIVIRGGNSITQSNYPLYVIDGFPMEDLNNSGLNASNPLSSIDINDIESIDILKDASATAIYGARAANGVVVVTTKRGKVGNPTITYNTYYGLQNSNKRMELLNPYEFVKLQNELDPIQTRNLYLTKVEGTETTILPLDYYKNVRGIDWEDQIMRTAGMQSHYVSMSGGTQKTKYSGSLSYFDQDGVIINSGFNRLQGRLTLDQEISSKAKFGMNVNYSGTKNFGTPPSQSTYQNQLNLLYSVWSYRPVTRLNSTVDLIEVPVDPEIDGGAFEFRYNPILTTQNELRENRGENLITNAFLEYEIIKDLKLRISGGITKGTTQYDTFNNSLTRSGNPGTNNKVNGGINIFNSTTWLNENTLSYRKRLSKDHLINVVGGFTSQKGTSRVFGAYAKLMPNEGLGLSGLDEGVPLSITSSSSHYTLSSFLSRVNYDYKSKYLFTASFRADGSSRFINNKWGYFPSAAFAWKISEEPFMKQLKAISSAKLRTSFGYTGNNGVGNFSAYPSFVLPLSAGYSFGNQLINGSYASSIGNSDLKWETTQQIDLGLNVGFFKERLTLEIDAYRKTTDDLLLNANLPASTGYTRQFMNVGKVRNQGLEFTLNFAPLNKGDFKWNSSFNIAFNRNKVLELAQNELSMLTSQYWGDDWALIPGYIAKVGKPVAQFYGYVWDGVYNYDDFIKLGPNSYKLKDNITANGTVRENIKPGDVKYKDVNGDLVIDQNDRVVIGNPIPKHTGGFSNNFSYKNFDLSIFFQWSYGNDIYNANRLMLETGPRFNVNQFASYANRWSPENPTSNIPGVRGTLTSAYSTRIVEDGSFLRLKTVQLSYSLPKAFLNKVKLKNARVYTSAQNILTWSNYSGYDPEVSVRRTALTPGFDYSAYPRSFVATLGLNVNF